MSYAVMVQKFERENCLLIMSLNTGVSQIEFAVEKELPSSCPGYQVLFETLGQQSTQVA